MSKKLDLTGQRFGRLVAIRPTGERKRKKLFGNVYVIVEMFIKFQSIA